MVTVGHRSQKQRTPCWLTETRCSGKGSHGWIWIIFSWMTFNYLPYCWALVLCHNLPVGTLRREQQRDSTVEWFMEDMHKGHLWYVRERGRERKRETKGKRKRETGNSLKIKNKNTGNTVMWVETWGRARSSGFQSLFWYWLIVTCWTYLKYVYYESNLSLVTPRFSRHCKMERVFADFLFSRNTMRLDSKMIHFPFSHTLSRAIVKYLEDAKTE